MNDEQIESEIRAQGLNAPRVTPADVEAEIVSEHYFTAEDGAAFVNSPNGGYAPHYVANSDKLRLLTFCVLVLRNGFTVSGESACASPENFDEVIGQKIARAKAVEKIWPLLGFRLREQLHVAASAPVGTWLGRVRAEYAELVSRRDALDSFLRHNADEPSVSREQADLMRKQLSFMSAYADVLALRVRNASQAPL